MYPGVVKSTGLGFGEKLSIGIEPTRLPDRSRYGNHGTYTDITDVQFPNGLWVRSFNGPSSNILLPSSKSELLPKVGFISFWLKFDDHAGAYYVFSNNSDELAVFCNTTPELRLYYNGIGIGDYLLTVADGVWAHYIIVFGLNQTGKIYENLVEKASGACGATRATTGVCRIGSISAGSSNWLKGDMGLFEMQGYIPSAGERYKIFETQRHWFGV